MQKKMLICTVLTILFFQSPFAASSSLKPDDIVELKDVAPAPIIDMRYFTEKNFVGKRVDGYEAPKCLLTKKAADALKKVQEDLSAFDLTIRIYDCYRPQRAVDNFAKWAADLNDNKTKKEYYPKVDKKDLFKDGYIAMKSGHSRGSTVDLTIDGLDMGTPFDFFSPSSHPDSPNFSDQIRANRLLLRSLMEKHGFKPLKEEWWHFTLKDEPYPDAYFDFPVK